MARDYQYNLRTNRQMDEMTMYKADAKTVSRMSVGPVNQLLPSKSVKPSNHSALKWMNGLLFCRWLPALLA